MEKRYFVFRNYTVEPLFDKIDGSRFSGYGETGFDEGYKYYLWFFFLPLKADSNLVSSEVDFIRKNLAAVSNSIPETSSLLCFTISDFENFSFLSNSDVKKSIERYNSFIFDLAENRANVKIVDFASFTSKYSLLQLLDTRHFYMSQMPISPKLANDFKLWFERKINTVEGVRKKCLVLDLDNTLWGGILGEDGIAGVKMGNTYPGNCYSDFQMYIKEIQKTGIILAICSKNNPGDVEQLFEERDDMVLQIDDFACIKTNWMNKAESIKEIAKELNIGSDSLVFLDDSPFERENVKAMLPEVIVPDFPKQPYLLNGFIKEVYDSWFQTCELTVEDKAKTKQYKQNAQRQKAFAQHNDMEGFLREMEIQLVISESKSVHIPRIAQMTQKTNQFNLTTKRYTENDIKNMLDRGHIIWDAAVSDRFGDSGITALAIVKLEGTNAIIDSFLLSCRILGRGIETAFLNYVLNRLFDMGIKTVEATFVPSTKNDQVESFYENNGFKPVNISNSNKIYNYTLVKKMSSINLYKILTH